MAWTNDDARELREFLSKATGQKLIELSRKFSDATLGDGTGFEQVSLSSKQAKGRKDMLEFWEDKSLYEDRPAITSDYLDTSEV